MSYEKKFDVGSVSIDKHYLHFIHELPLLSFGDVQHSINVSLIFQSKESNNPFHISKGCKFNLQKRLIMNGNIPEKFEDGNGKLITLNNCSSRFVFDDGSQRIIRAENSTFVLENPDYSKEVYDALGKITEAWDKYGHKYLTYVYVGNHLDCINYRNKTIRFNYSGSPMTLNSLQYVCNDETICTTTFSYPEEGSIIVHHYSGVDYHLTYSSGGLDACSIDTDVAYSTQKPYRLRCERSIKTSNSMELKVFKQVGTTVIDETKYELFICDGVNAFDVLDVTDYNGVKTRMQIKDDKPVYSYEVRDDMFREALLNPNYDYVYPSTYFGTVTYYSNGQAVGTQEYDDGIKMCFDPDQNKWRYFIPPSEVGPQKTNLKYVTVSGWIKMDLDDESERFPITYEDYNLNVEQILDIEEAPLGKWVYFSKMLGISEIDDPGIAVDHYWNPSRPFTKDFRITPHYENEEDNTPKVQTFVIGKVLAESETEIPLNPEPVEGAEDSEQPKVIFYNGNSRIEEDCQITENDIIRFMINQVYGTHTDEIYFNNCKSVTLCNNEDGLRAAYSDANGTTPIMDIKAARIEKRYSLKGDNYVTKIEFNSSKNAEHGIVIQNFKNGSCYQVARYDSHYLDLVVSKKEQAETSYTRNNFGLITSQKVANHNGYVVSITSIVYDDDCTKVVSTTDEFDQVTTYVTDDVWGVVTEVHLCDDTIIKSYYDEDMSTLRHKVFSKDNKEKVHHFIYPDEESLEVSDDTLQYTFENDFLVSGQQYVKKLGAPIEYHKRSMRDRTFKDAYPDYLFPEYECSGGVDQYGRVTNIVGMIENKYDLIPVCQKGNACSTGIDNASSKLASSRDLTTENVTKYAYSEGRVSKIGDFDKLDEMIAEETFTYDNIGRLVRDEYIYDKSANNSVSSDIVYEKDEAHPAADNIIKSYTYNVNGVGKAFTNNVYDSFKRIYVKRAKIGSSKDFTKNILYTNTRVSRSWDVLDGVTLGLNEYSYDNRGRIAKKNYLSATTASQEITYEYDEFGQLIRENNEALDKTYVYEYNSIGNITCVKEYDYHAPNEALPRCQKCVKYEYDSECPDKLTKFDGNEIEYNSIGCPLKYKDENYEWANGKLSKIYRSKVLQGNEHYMQYTLTYDGYGRRTRKYYISGLNYRPADSEHNYSFEHTIDYTYDNSGRLIREVRKDVDKYSGVKETTRELIYLYDESGMIGVMLNSQPYYYHRNLQGDVIAIYDANGEKQVEYAYDAWGNCKTVYGENDELAYLNPIRYRGYYYDTETKLYYLNARYYSPEWRRFISPDAAEYIDPETPNGLNLYAYCGNDPINRYDPTGCAWDTVLDIISIGWSLYDFIKKPSWENAGWLALDVVFAVVPFLTGSRIMNAASKLDDISDIGGYMNKFDNVYDSIVIGNDMGRVTNLAFDTGSMIYDGYKPLNALYAMGKADEVTDAMKYAAKVDNARFIMDKFNAGYKIINAGSDGRGFIKMMKSAYGMELRILYRLKYGNKLHKLWWILNSGRRIIW